MDVLSELYLNQGKFDSARMVTEEALAINKANNYGENIPQNYEVLAKVYFETGQYGMAELYADSAMGAAKGLGNVSHIRNSADILMKIYEREGKDKQALAMHRLFIQMRDSIQNEEVQERTVKMEAKFEFEKALLIKE